jgi:hypothetical protein
MSHSRAKRSQWQAAAHLMIRKIAIIGGANFFSTAIVGGVRLPQT